MARDSKPDDAKRQLAEEKIRTLRGISAETDETAEDDLPNYPVPSFDQRNCRTPPSSRAAWAVCSAASASVGDGSAEPAFEIGEGAGRVGLLAVGTLELARLAARFLRFDPAAGRGTGRRVMFIGW